MKKFAIIRISGRQFKIVEGGKIIVDRLSNKESEKIELKEVLLFNDGEKILIGTPLVEGVKITANILRHLKGEKIDVYKYKSKVRYRKHTGFRPYQTEILIEKIGDSSKKEKISVENKEKTKTTKKATQKRTV